MWLVRRVHLVLESQRARQQVPSLFTDRYLRLWVVVKGPKIIFQLLDLLNLLEEVAIVKLELLEVLLVSSLVLVDHPLQLDQSVVVHLSG